MQAYKNKTLKGGRPEIDVIVMFKALIIQKMYALSDPELERSLPSSIFFFNLAAFVFLSI
ncbi:MAG: transposase [Methanobrevibacter sp.]|jgi:IS5 family transposase|nr:transposase [Candidatus Methanovirga procula]